MDTVIMGLTRRQQQIVAFVDAFWSEHHYGPTLMDIGRGVGLASKSGVKHQIDLLADLGLVVRDPLLSRTIRVVGHTAYASNDRAETGSLPAASEPDRERV